MPPALNRIGRARRQSALHTARKRRRSLLSKADIFRNLELPTGASANLVPLFPDTLTPVTFAGVASFNAAGAEGESILDTGTVALTTLSTGLRLSADGTNVDIALSNGQRFRWNLAIRPGDGQLRFWVDSERRVATALGTTPFHWHNSGALTYDSRDRLSALSPLSVYYQQRPKHFGEPFTVIPPDPGGDSVLFRAAIATFLTGSFPFQDNPK